MQNANGIPEWKTSSIDQDLSHMWGFCLSTFISFLMLEQLPKQTETYYLLIVHR